MTKSHTSNNAAEGRVRSIKRSAMLGSTAPSLPQYMSRILLDIKYKTAHTIRLRDQNLLRDRRTILFWAKYRKLVKRLEGVDRQAFISHSMSKYTFCGLDWYCGCYDFRNSFIPLCVHITSICWDYLALRKGCPIVIQTQYPIVSFQFKDTDLPQCHMHFSHHLPADRFEELPPINWWNGKTTPMPIEPPIVASQYTYGPSSTLTNISTNASPTGRLNDISNTHIARLPLFPLNPLTNSLVEEQNTQVIPPIAIPDSHRIHPTRFDNIDWSTVFFDNLDFRYDDDEDDLWDDRDVQYKSIEKELDFDDGLQDELEQLIDENEDIEAFTRAMEKSEEESLWDEWRERNGRGNKRRLGLIDDWEENLTDFQHYSKRKRIEDRQILSVRLDS